MKDLIKRIDSGDYTANEVIQALEENDKAIRCLKEECEDRNRKILKLRRYAQDLRDENSQIRKEWGVEVGERNARIEGLRRIAMRAAGHMPYSVATTYQQDIDKILELC